MSGLNGQGLVLTHNSVTLDIAADGAFSFPSGMDSGTPYAVMIGSQPAAPAQICSVLNGSGTVANTHVTNIAVDCVNRLSLTNSTPAEDTANVSRDAAISLTFSSPLNPSTLDQVMLTPVIDTDSTVTDNSATGDQLTLQPTSRLLPLARYTVTAAAGLRGTQKELLGETTSFSFTTADGAWTQASTLRSSANAVAVFEPDVTMSSDGSAMAVWPEDGSSTTDVRASRFTPSTGWGPVETLSAAGAVKPKVAIDAKGNAIAVWMQTQGMSVALWFSRFTPEGGWSSPRAVGTLVGAAGPPRLAMNAAGDAVVVSTETQTSARHVVAARYSASTSTWSPLQPLGSVGVNTPLEPHAAIGADGTAIATWVQDDQTTPSVYVSTWQGHAWSSSELIEKTNTGDACTPMAAVAADGTMLVAWTQAVDYQLHSVFVARKTKTGAWSSPTLLENGADDAWSPQIAVASKGGAMVIWTQKSNARPSIWAAHWTKSSGWDKARLVETQDVADANTPRLLVDAAGNALAIWRQGNSTTWSNRFSPLSGWNQPAQIGPASSGLVPETLAAAIDSAGDAFVVWGEMVPAAVRVNRFR